MAKNPLYSLSSFLWKPKGLGRPLSLVGPDPGQVTRKTLSWCLCREQSGVWDGQSSFFSMHLIYLASFQSFCHLDQIGNDLVINTISRLVLYLHVQDG